MARKTNMKILEGIKNFLAESEEKLFYKSELRSINIEPSTAEEWFKIIEFCQTQLPRVSVKKVKRTVIFEILE